MKKIVTVFLAILMVIALNVSAFATPGGFISSPSANQAPTLVNGENSSEDCDAQVVITAYANRDQLSSQGRIIIEEAYSKIVGVESLDELTDEVAKIAEALGLDVKNLAVSDMFDISATECNGHEDHGHFDITLKSNTLKNFVCLLHYYNGEWTIVENAEITNNGEHLEFDAKDFSPFAIVVSTEAFSAPGTGDSADGGSYLWIIVLCCVAGALVIAGAAVAIIVIIKNKKRTHQQ